jgi:hypothetical protein
MGWKAETKYFCHFLNLSDLNLNSEKSKMTRGYFIGFIN